MAAIAEEEKKKRGSYGDAAAQSPAVAQASQGQIPNSAPPGWTGGSGTPVSGTDFTRNVNNSLNALGGMGAVANVPLRGAAGAAMMNAPPVLQSAVPRIGMTKPAADLVAGMGSAAQVSPAANTVAQSIGAAPRVVGGLYEGSQANAAAAGVRALSGASAGATYMDAQQQPAQPIGTQPAGRAVSGGLSPLNPNAPTVSAPFQVTQAIPVAPQQAPSVPLEQRLGWRTGAVLNGAWDDAKTAASKGNYGDLAGLAVTTGPAAVGAAVADYTQGVTVPVAKGIWNGITRSGPEAPSATGQPGPQAKPTGAVPGAGDATMPGADIGRFSAPTPKGPPVNSGNTAPDGSPLMDDPGKIRRIDAPGKSPLFTNVSDAGIGGNDALQNRGFVSAQNQQAAQNLSDRYAAERSPAQSQYAAEVADAARVNATPAAKDTGGYGLRDKGYLDERSASFSLAGKKAYDTKMLQQGRDQASIEIAAVQNDASANRDAAAIQRTSMVEQGTNARFGMTNQIDQQKDAREQAKFGFDAQSQMQVQAAQKALLSAKTPEERQMAMETLAGLQGKYSPKDQQQKIDLVNLPDTMSPDGMQKLGGGQAALVRNADGSVTRVPINEQGQRAPSAPKNHVDALKKDPSLAKNFDEMYGPGAAAKIMGAK